ncbi:hypothetical protein PHAVU_003G150600 [Phaseolus vulgaris]|uniref:Uncharacterized protein n=1 Tax=Phaseolus vulgaris TaxID=3885 RepID=V7CD51_PHAVU|nr:hypothetical protein PHAVU_003G150600g [Phaseolus vulgaris]ESW26816.1 hypothetical protein PHAVU_003G150600g [Phaseolus vulgaris]
MVILASGHLASRTNWYMTNQIHLHQPLHLRPDQTRPQYEQTRQGPTACPAPLHQSGSDPNGIPPEFLFCDGDDKGDARDRHEVDLEGGPGGEEEEPGGGRGGEGSEEAREGGEGEEDGVDEDGGSEEAEGRGEEGRGRVGVEGEAGGVDGGEGSGEGEEVRGEGEKGLDAEEGKGVVAGLEPDVSGLKACGGVACEGPEMVNLRGEGVGGDGLGD